MDTNNNPISSIEIIIFMSLICGTIESLDSMSINMKMFEREINEIITEFTEEPKYRSIQNINIRWVSVYLYPNNKAQVNSLIFDPI